MECFATKQKIKETEGLLKVVENDTLEEDTINDLLDEIIDYQNRLNDITNNIELLNTKFAELSWLFTESNDCEDCNKELKKLLSESHDVHNNLVRFYVVINKPSTLKIASKQIRAFKYAVDYFKETLFDIDTLYYSLRTDEEFIKTNKRLNVL